MLRLILNHEHLVGALTEALQTCRHRLFICTADVKDLYLPSSRGGRRDGQSILQAFEEVSAKGVEIRLLHSSVPSGPFLAELKKGVPANLTMRRCVRVHAKAIIVDGRRMYLGSANLTGAGLGAKSPRRRNFEAGIWTDQVDLIDPVLDMLDEIWNSAHCKGCGRKDYCPIPLEEPAL